MAAEQEFVGKSVVITGAAGTYGRQLATAFAGQGALLYLTDRRQDALEAFAATLPTAPDRVVLSYADLASEAGVEQFVATVMARSGAPDVLVNNAAIYPFGDIMETSAAEWDAVMNLNVRTPFLLSQHCARAMIERGAEGCIVNIGSAAGRIIRLNGVPYCVSKTALRALSDSFALRLAPHRIRVNLVEAGLAPGNVDGMPEEHLERMTSVIPLNRTSAFADLSNAVTFLASSRASYITGATLAVNGGLSVCAR